MGKIVAMSSSLDPFVETIIQLTKKKHPKVLAIPTAAYDSKTACAETEQSFNQRNCRVDVLYLSETASKQTVIDKTLTSDVIFVEGGNTIRMLRLWRKQGVFEILKHAHQNGIVLTGDSAGAICWFEKAISGPLPSKPLFSLPAKFQNELNQGASPWQQNDPEKRVSAELRESFVKNGISLSTGASVFWLYGLWGNRKGCWWMICDRGNGEQHYIQKKQGKLYLCKKERFMQSTGLGLIPGRLCCHYEARKDGLKALVRKTGGVAIGAEDRCALIVIDGQYRIMSEGGSKVYKVFWKRGKFYEAAIEQKEEMMPIGELNHKSISSNDT